MQNTDRWRSDQFQPIFGNPGQSKLMQIIFMPKQKTAVSVICKAGPKLGLTVFLTNLPMCLDAAAFPN